MKSESAPPSTQDARRSLPASSPRSRASARAVVFTAALSVLAALAGLLVATPVQATSFVMMSDEVLTDTAPVIVEARVVSKDAAPTAGMPFTDYTVELDRVLKGVVPGSTLIVRVPGGMGTEGLGFWVYGAPQFQDGDRALLFLSPATDGTFRLYQLMLGAFYELRTGNERLLVRNFSETHEVAPDGQEPDPAAQARSRSPRHLEAFVDWIDARVRGEERQADYFLSADHPVMRQLRGSSEEGDGVQSVFDAFTLFRSTAGFRIRWFAFDEGQTVRFRVNENGQPGLSMNQVQTAAQRATAAWSNVPGTNIRYAFAGTTSASGGLTPINELAGLFNDGVNAIQFEDPNSNSSFGGTYQCPGGGVLAIGGPWFTNATRSGPGGEQFHEAVEGDVITNRGLACFFDGSPNRLAAAEELFTHELGHTLAFGHSCGDEGAGPCDTLLKADAIMRAFIHDDGRGARLNDDDRAAARFLYGGGTGGQRPAAPSNLTAVALSSTEVDLSWVDNSGNETAFEVQIREAGGQFVSIGTVPTNTVGVTVIGLEQNTTYDFRVRARNGSGASGFTNVATATTQLAVPNTPANLVATPVSGSSIRLDWDDNSPNETGFVVEQAEPGTGFRVIDILDDDTETVMVDGLASDLPHTFRVRAINGNGSSENSNEASATTVSDFGPCAPDARNLCLLNGRFKVSVDWQDPRSGDTGVGSAVVVPGSDLTGLFWFFDEANIELVFKVLDGRVINEFFWNFYGALSDVEYWITVVDTEQDESITYRNPPFEICGLGDTTAFPRQQEQASATSLSGPALSTPRRPRPTITAQAVALAETEGLTAVRLDTGPASLDATTTSQAGTCVADDQTLCLLNNQFQVTVNWDNPRQVGDQGPGRVRPVTTVDSDETGFFWFFDQENIELVVKVLDARVINGHYWFFYGGLSDVEYDITVTDTISGTSQVLTNEPFDICGDASQDIFE